jgi:hypothetical protein
MVIEEDDEEKIAGALAILSEHFVNYAVVVINDEGALHYDYTNFRVGRMLFRDSLEDMSSDLDMDFFEFNEDDLEDDE